MDRVRAVAVCCAVCCFTLPPAEFGAATRGLNNMYVQLINAILPVSHCTLLVTIVVIACTLRKDSSAPASINLQLGIGEMTKVFCERAIDHYGCFEKKVLFSMIHKSGSPDYSSHKAVVLFCIHA